MSVRALVFCSVMLCSLVALTGPVRGAHCALIGIPTADVVDKHTFVPDVIWNPQPGVGLANVGNFVIDTEVGLGGGWEAGYDFIPNQIGGGAFNVKKQLNTSNETQWAVGLLNVNANWRAAIPFLITSTTAKSETSRIHLGLQYNGEPELLIGFDHALGRDVSLWMDYTTGANGLATIGLDTMISNDLELTVGLITTRSADPVNGNTTLYTNLIQAIRW